MMSMMTTIMIIMQVIIIITTTMAIIMVIIIVIIIICCPVLSAMGSRSLRSSEQGLLLVPFAITSTMQNRAFSVVDQVPRPGMAWNFAFFLAPSLLCSFLTLKLFFLAVLESGAPLSSFLEGALYKC